MNITIYIEPISNAEELFKILLEKELGSEKTTAFFSYEKIIKEHLGKLKENIYLVAETNYVDKVFRDSYYHYYSSKLDGNSRNCVRISLFENKVEADDFRVKEQYPKLMDNYRGFIVLRPNGHKVIGRSIISPLALKNTDFNCCTVIYNSTVNGIKLNVEGFPHSSQDAETITCAETTLWAIMEYFSHRYAEYRPVLPSRIVATLNKVSSERLIPAKGLNIQQMSFALKEFGFGTKIYSRAEFSEFDGLISCYIESGLPLIMAMDNLHEGGTIAHAILCIGHEQVTPEMTDSLSPFPLPTQRLQDSANLNNITLYDYDSVNKQFVFIDDNLPVYQKATLDAPAIHYSQKTWHNCILTHFIVPLYPKIYLEAYEAKKFVLELLLATTPALHENNEVVIRTFLTSTRSYKDKLAYNPSFTKDVKDLILEMVMPKFIWVCELSTKALIRDKKANGIIILDATEANTSFLKPLIIAVYKGKLINFEVDTAEFKSKDLPLDDFFIFENNLKSFFV